MTTLLRLAFLGSLLFVAAHGSCPVGELSCDDGRCISSRLWCDKSQHCEDGSDEAYCKEGKWYNRDPNQCQNTHFRCEDGRCVPSEAKCNDYLDCKDESDELYCEDSKENELSTEYDYEASNLTILVDTFPPTITTFSSGEVVFTTLDELDEDSAAMTRAKTTTTSASTPVFPPQIDIRIPSYTDAQRSYTDTYAQRQSTAYPQPTPYPRRPPTPYPQRPPYSYPPSTPYPQRPPTPYPQRPTPYPQRPPTPYPQRPPTPYNQRPPYSYPQPTPYPQQPHAPYGQRPPAVPYPSYTSHQLTTPPYSRSYNEYYTNIGLVRSAPTTYSGRRKTIPRIYFERNYTRIYEKANEPYVRRGAEWLLGLRDPSGGWGKDTPRAMVVLALLNNSFVGGTHENDLMKKYFQVHLGVKLLSSKAIGPNQLAGFVNALLATCLDPTDFLGTDVLQLLREKQKERPVSPFVHLSLCLANEELSSHQVHNLVSTLRGHLPANEQGKDMLSLAISAFVCHLQQQVASSSRDSAYAKSLFTLLSNATSTLLQLQLDNGSFGSVYSTALAAQALLSVNDSRDWDPETTFKFLRDQQTSNGSFGDFLATYYVLPVLRGRSLLHLRNTLCHSGTPQEDLTPQEILNHHGPKQYIRYSLHFGLPLSNAYSVQVLVPHGISFFDVMRVAEFQNKHFNFLYEEKNKTIHVYSISDVPDDWELGLAWHLYVRRNSDTNVPRGNEAYAGDVRELFPQAAQHIIFWYHPIGIRL